MAYKLTVIIPVRNAEDKISRCLLSVLNQTTLPEIIVQDGKSTDGTIDKISTLSTEIRMFSENDSGVYDAMNRGVLRATGDWILFLGADDILADSQVIESVFSESIPPETRVICCVAQNIGHDDKRIKTTYHCKLDKGLFWRNTMHHQGVFYHRSLFEQHQFETKLKVLGDYAFNLLLLKTKTPYIHTAHLVSICEARGLSKKFGWSLYREEIKLKRGLLPAWAFALNMFWVPLKFAYKNL